jgi:hypothetical protein
VVPVVKKLLTFIFIIRDDVWTDPIQSGTRVVATKLQLYGQQEDIGTFKNENKLFYVRCGGRNLAECSKSMTCDHFLKIVCLFKGENKYIIKKFFRCSCLI